VGERHASRSLQKDKETPDGVRHVTGGGRSYSVIPSAAGVRKCMCLLLHLQAASVAVRHRADFHLLTSSTFSSEVSVRAKDDLSGPLYIYLRSSGGAEGKIWMRLAKENDRNIGNVCE